MIVLPSGAELEITIGSFDEGKNLYQVISEEVKGIKFDSEAEVDVNFFKDLFFTGIASKKIESALQPCFKRCLYNGAHIGKETFDKVEARQDYLLVCYEVAKENVLPFAKGLSVQFAEVFGKIKSFLMSSSKTTA